MVLDFPTLFSTSPFCLHKRSEGDLPFCHPPGDIPSPPPPFPPHPLCSFFMDRAMKVTFGPPFRLDTGSREGEFDPGPPFPCLSTAPHFFFSCLLSSPDFRSRSGFRFTWLPSEKRFPTLCTLFFHSAAFKPARVTFLERTSPLPSDAAFPPFSPSWRFVSGLFSHRNLFGGSPPPFPRWPIQPVFPPMRVAIFPASFGSLPNKVLTLQMFHTFFFLPRAVPLFVLLHHKERVFAPSLPRVFL